MVTCRGGGMADASDLKSGFLYGSAGSSPAPGTKFSCENYASVAQLDRALVFGTKG